MLANPVSLTLPMSETGSLPGSLPHTGTQGLPTTLDFPAGAVTQTVAIQSPEAQSSAAQTLASPASSGHAPSRSAALTSPLSGAPTTTVALTPTLVAGCGEIAFAGHAFELGVYRDGVLQPGLAFSVPVTVTIHYSTADVALLNDGGQIGLWRWSESGWKDAANTCDPPSAYYRDPINRVLGVPICGTGLFGLFGPTNAAYLPLVMGSP